MFVVGPSYNQPKFSVCATWNPNAITFANNSIVGTLPFSVFVTVNNSIYVYGKGLNSVLVWLEENTTFPTRTISGGLNTSVSIFATISGDVYVDNGRYYYRVDKWTLNATNSTVEMYVNGTCYGLFIDINDTLYCSLGDSSIVTKKPLNSSANTSLTVAGSGIAGSASWELNTNRGIFVDKNFNLYVADLGNARVQLFQLGQLNATTVAGTNATIILSEPTGVILDADGYLFILDYGGDRIVGSGIYGFRCLVGCTGGSGSTSNQLNHPMSFSFDSYGNIFVADQYNNRTQKFLLATNSCGKYVHIILAKIFGQKIFNVKFVFLRKAYL